MHIPTRQQLREALQSSEVGHLSPMAKQRLQWIADYIERDCSVTETCDRYGITRGTFHRWLERFDIQDLHSLEDKPSHHAPRTQRIAPEVIALIRACRQTFPLEGKRQIHQRLLRDHSVEISLSSIGRVIERECLYFADTPLHWRKRQRREERSMKETLHTSRERETNAYAMPEESREEKQRACPCGWCRFRQRQWPILRRTIAGMSILTHVVMISLFVLTILWEQSRAQKVAPLPASIHEHTSPLSTIQ